MPVRQQLLDRIKEQNRQRRMKKRIVFAFLYIAVAFALLFLCYRFLFNVKTVNVNDTERYSGAEISEYLDVYGENIFRLNLYEIKKDILKAFPYLSSCEISRSYPSGLELSVTDDPGAFYVELNDDTYILSSSLKVLGRAETVGDIEGKIKILSERVKNCVAGNEIVFSRSDAVEVLMDLHEAIKNKEMQEKVNRIDITQRADTLLVYESRFLVSLGYNEDFSYKLAFLEEIAKEFPNGERAEVDVSNIKLASFKLTNVDRY